MSGESEKNNTEEVFKNTLRKMLNTPPDPIAMKKTKKKKPGK